MVVACNGLPIMIVRLYERMKMLGILLTSQREEGPLTKIILPAVMLETFTHKVYGITWMSEDQ